MGKVSASVLSGSAPLARRGWCQVVPVADWGRIEGIGATEMAEWRVRPSAEPAPGRAPVLPAVEARVIRVLYCGSYWGSGF